ncbi:hypothetical protein [Portibacter lacus]|uniref:Uncharacterized protein n=1 Tax=Portibacter lacus TaxID=1099794 RepID=A0AA37SM26_9BACT|nr:hypothetical protein [Portibacter lacus]GLR16270.1 hypothetical protein GCM10007940_08850 [Portibacter lacus]
MRLLLNVLLILGIAGLAYLLFYNVKEPIAFQAEKTRRETKVVDRLKDIRTSQELYKVITGEYAANFDTLAYVLKTRDIPQFKVVGNPDDPTAGFTVDTLYYDTRDSLKALGINVDSLRYVPFTDGKVIFDMDADTLTYQQTLVNVVEAGTQRTNFMGRFGDIKYSKYDKSYDPNTILKFGNMNSPSLSGNWE